MTNLLPETHTALNKTIKGVAYNHETEKLEETTFTFTDLEKQVMNQFPIDWYVDDLEESDYGLDDPADWLIDWRDTKRLVKKLDITTQQLKGVVGSLINKSTSVLFGRSKSMFSTVVLRLGTKMLALDPIEAIIL